MQEFASQAAGKRSRSRAGATPVLRLAGAIALVAGSVSMLGGCAGQSDGMTVSAVPQDYRTRHPIVVSEQPETLNLPVAASDHTLRQDNVDIVRGFAQNYRSSSSGLVRIMVPRGSVNAAAASHVARKVRHVLVAEGVPSSRIIIVPYSAEGYPPDAPLQLAYNAMKAHTDACGQWPTDLADAPNNGSYENFGCASQSNLAAQVANPADLLAPRGMTPIDSERRTKVYDNYVNSGAGSSN